MHKFSIEIPNTKANAYRVITILLLVMNILVFGYLSSAGTTNRYTLLAMGGVGLNVLALVSVFRQNYFRFLEVLRPGFIFIISAVMWAILGKYLLGVLMLFFGVMGIYSSGKLFILFSDEGISYPSFPRKLFLWKDVSQVILKDDILTIDLKDNKLFQFNILSANVNAIAFNEYCKTKSISL